MFDEDDIFCPPSFDEQIYYDESMPPIYDDYCDDTYALKNNDNHETCHLDLNFQSHHSYFVEFTPTILNEKNFAYEESNKNSMQVDHENNALGIVGIVMREEHMLVGIAMIPSFLSMCLKFLKLCLFCLPMLVDYCSHKLFAHKNLGDKKYHLHQT